jgi:thymidylate kinase
MNSSMIIAEIAGPSGAGKSTVSSAINLRDVGVEAGLTVWRMPTTSLLTSGVTSIPDLLRLGFEGPILRKDELKQVIRLDAFYKLLKRRAVENGDRYSALMLDEGVVFAISKLRADIGGHGRTREMKMWEEKVLDRWSSILDAVVWLDAPDDLLIHRVRTRKKTHRMKNKPDDVIRDFLKRYRQAYEGVIGELTRRNNINVLRFDSEETNSEMIADEILRVFGVMRRENNCGISSPLVEVNNGQALRQTALGR